MEPLIKATAVLRCVMDSTNLVLQTLEGFYLANNSGKSSNIILQVQRWACDFLLESLPLIFSSDEVSSEVKKDAQKIIATWKSKLRLDSKSRSNTSMEVHTFLQIFNFWLLMEFRRKLRMKTFVS
jgi:hypothetical protein